jgi:prepilin-type N-terminal cleavage/methylation domain-containing protein
MISLLVARRSRDDSGYTLAEMLVAIVIAGMLGGILMTMLLAAQRSTKATTTQDDLNGEARAALNRISRDLRQAVPTYLCSSAPCSPNPAGVETPAIVSVQNPDGASHVNGGVTSVTFQADFDGNGCVAGRVSDPITGAPTGTACNPAQAVDTNAPETVTYCWNGSAASKQQVLLIAGTVNAGTCTPSNGSVLPLVAGRISNFTVSYRSNQYLYDTDHNGVTTWSELDAYGSPAGNDNGVLDTPELDNISGVVLSVTTASSGASQTYQTQVDLRNMA